MKTLKLNPFVNRCFSALLILLAVLIISVEPAQSQERNLDRELLVYILPGSLELPAEEKGTISVNRAEIASGKLASTLNQLSISGIEKSFPGWNAKDSVRVLESGKVVHRPKFHRVFTMHLPSGVSAEEAIEKLENIPGVVYAHKHGTGQLESDTYYSDQWHLKNTGQAGGTSSADIKAEQAWNIFTGSSSIKIGIFDSGVDLDHVDLDGKATGDTYDWVTTDP